MVARASSRRGRRPSLRLLGPLGVAALFLGLDCLPADTRPEPSTVHVTAVASDETANGFTTADGWSISFERFVTALGDVRLDDPEGSDGVCNAYYETHYEWLFDFTKTGREKVGVVYGLGTCSISYRFRGPDTDAVLGAGATSDDLATMSVEASDAYADEARTTLVVRGTATRRDRRETFEWRFRRSYRVDQCPSATREHFASVLDLESGDTHDLGIAVRGQELFRLGLTDDAPLQFDLYAAADIDADGTVTLDELAAAEAPEGLRSGGVGGGGAAGGGGIGGAAGG
ncbi:MAG TPA: hypothetical protein VL400_22895, partial [Polyangiaceae bacterium]|nr:hypothetical protein [Polyangiaceae bacterium]